MKTLFTAFLSFLLTAGYAQSGANGAWIYQPDAPSDTSVVLLIEDGYFSVTHFTAHSFVTTFGGATRADNGKLISTFEFSSGDKGMVGQPHEVAFRQAGDELTVTLPEGKVLRWKRAPNAVPNSLTGTWRITGRMNEGKMSEMKPGPRKTFKMLTGGRFQWIAMNTETGEFFGTGGGTYSFENGQYTENIEFFSRDNNRVGKQVRFDAKVEDGKWHHSGKSTAGDPMYEIWSRIK
ncbi:membrane or secreted protein [Chitinophaga rhizosphaerae]|uniref:membrane or secreted protein n=1 Tax=Chitinophaga rhizosphaerae TaxID=1864947 RepID=UPI000F7FD07D|nr:membrane or secreted protein [Chitinophaga rhizosphaerae]